MDGKNKKTAANLLHRWQAEFSWRRRDALKKETRHNLMLFWKKIQFRAIKSRRRFSEHNLLRDFFNDICLRLGRSASEPYAASQLTSEIFLIPGRPQNCWQGPAGAGREDAGGRPHLLRRRPMALNSSFISTGLARCSFIPASLAMATSSSKALADRAMMGTALASSRSMSRMTRVAS